MKHLLNTILILACLLVVFSCTESNDKSITTDGDLEMNVEIEAEHIVDPCKNIDCSPGKCVVNSSNIAICDCPTGYYLYGKTQCLPVNVTDGDIESSDNRDADNDLENDIELPPVVKTFSHKIGKDDPLLQKGEFRITNGESGIKAPYYSYDVSENWVVYCTREYEIFACSTISGECYMYDISAGYADCFFPAIHNDKLATLIDINSNEKTEFQKRLLILNLSTSEHEIYDVEVGYNLDFNGKFAVWENKEIALFDISTESLSIVDGTEHKNVYLPSLSNNYATWYLANRSSSQYSDYVMLYSFKTGKVIDLNNGTIGDRCNAVTSDKWTIWVSDCIGPSNKNGSSLLKGYNIETQKTIDIDPLKHEKNNPSIDDEIVIWTDLRNGGRTEGLAYINPDIYYYDLKKNYGQAISTDKSDQYWPRIKGRWVIYTDKRWHRSVNDVVAFDLCTLDIYKNDEMCK